MHLAQRVLDGIQSGKPYPERELFVDRVYGGTFPTFTVSGSSGNFDDVYYIGFCGHAYQVYTTLDSTQSNILLTNSHSC